jgi:protein subunit release factor B
MVLNENEHPVDSPIDRLKKEVEVDFYKSSGPGGQRKNKRETAVRLRHIPTGLVVIATESRSQAANLELAYKRLNERLQKLRRKAKRRIPTKISRAALERRLDIKKKRSMIKKLRSPGDSREE